MKQKYFLKLALLFFLCTGINYGQTTVTYDFSSGGAVSGLNETSPGISIDSNIGFGSFKNSGTSNPGIFSGQLRLYQNATKGGSIIVYANNGVTITEVVVRASSRTGPAGFDADGVFQSNLSGGSTYTMSSLSATSNVEFFQRDGSSSNRIYVDEIEITYTSGAAATPGITLGSVSGNTNESGTTATFTAVLNAAPTSDVVLDVTSGDTGEVTLDLSTLTFTNANWETPQTVTATGEDDGIQDGSIVVTITVTVNDGSSDNDYDGISTSTTITNDDKPTLIISEVSDPGDDTDGRFLEIYNNGDSSIDLDAFEVYFVKSTNAGSSYPELALTGTILPNQVMTIANSSDMNSTYGFTPDFNDSDANGNGDDAYYLYFGGGRTSGAILDAYGVIGVDGSGQAWEYQDSRAIRNSPKSVTPKSSWTSSEWTISSANVANMTPGALENEFRYDGNWKPRDVYVNSSTNDDVYITSSVTLNDNISIDNFEVDGSATVTIDSGIGLIVGGTSTGNITYNRNIPTTNWYLVSSPVAGQTIVDFFNNESPVMGSGTGNDQNVAIAPYDNSQSDANDRWDYYTEGEVDGVGSDDTTDTFTPGIGYSVKMQATGDIAFTGTMAVTDFTTLSLTDNSSGGGNSFNLMGNPYTSFIAADNAANTTNNILSVNTDLLTEETIWIWDQSANSGTGGYTLYNNTSGFHIAPGQGFFVSADGSSSTFSITEAMQSHQGSDSFQRLTTRPEIELTLSNDTATRNADIYYIEGTTTGWDNGYDSSIFGGVANEFAIYTHSVSNGSGRNLGIQSLPPNNYENMIIPVGINAEAGTSITIDAATNNFPSGINIYLEDKQDNSFTLLDTDANFSTTLENNLSGIGRFYLHTTSSVLSADDFATNNNISIYTSSKDNLRIVGLQNGTATVQLYNILGKEMLKTSFKGNGVNDINLNTIPMGIYIVKLATENGVQNRKIIIQ